MSPETELRLRIKAGGYDPIPLIGKAPKHITTWPSWIDLPDSAIMNWEMTHPDHRNTGILTKHAPAIDIDITDAEAAKAIEDLVRKHFEDADAEDGQFLV